MLGESTHTWQQPRRPMKPLNPQRSRHRSAGPRWERRSWNICCLQACAVQWAHQHYQHTICFLLQMSHAFLPPVDVELSLTFGGHTDAHSDCRNIILHAHVLTDSTAVMVLDHKGRIQHATAKLAGLLGYPVSKHRSLDFNTLLPQAVCQMHGAWFKVSALRQYLSLHPLWRTEMPTWGICPPCCLPDANCRILRSAFLPPAAGPGQ